MPVAILQSLHELILTTALVSNYWHHHHHPCGTGMTLIYKSVKSFVLGHIADKWQIWDLNPGSLIVEYILITTILHAFRVFSELHWVVLFFNDS